MFHQSSVSFSGYVVLMSVSTSGSKIFHKLRKEHRVNNCFGGSTIIYIRYECHSRVFQILLLKLLRIHGVNKLIFI